MEQSRQYISPLRERQARETRNLILASLTDMLETHRADEITTREIAAAAGVSERTVYRHFPDRRSLLLGLAARLEEMMLEDGKRPTMDSVDELGAAAVELMAGLDRHRAEARAEALFNADPRHFSEDTAANSVRFRELLASAFPELAPNQANRLAAVIRCLLSAQSWLRMREEFDVPGEESGPVVAWVLGLIIDEVRRGHLPRP